MQTFKPFTLPALSFYGPSELFTNVDQLYRFLSMQNIRYLREYEKWLPWYIHIKNVGSKLEIQVFEPARIIEKI
ncbi:hypothetical protein WCX18_02325 [Sulfurimonas sp. HSL1-2]|uniref:hypothetical protein n=1 Tax=Thiomicrolovo zhangzhouensis TaxID=3131933 RepID=UPI0031F9A96E